MARPCTVTKRRTLTLMILLPLLLAVTAVLLAAAPRASADPSSPAPRRAMLRGDGRVPCPPSKPPPPPTSISTGATSAACPCPAGVQTAGQLMDALQPGSGSRTIYTFTVAMACKVRSEFLLQYNNGLFYIRPSTQLKIPTCAEIQADWKANPKE